jgi:cobalamin biosynthesis protein CobW
MTDSLVRVPCTVVTGFLGVGKTTIIRNLLSNAGGRRIAVIVNEFGDIGIDGEILKGCGIESCSEEDIVELANGCICCTVADDFVPALDRILSRRPKVDHILIETSGLALPKPLVQAFRWPAIRDRVTVDGVIAVADGAALAAGTVAGDLRALEAQRAADESLDHDDPVEEVFEDQIACADMVILSKTDLIDENGFARAAGRISRHLRPAAKLVPAAGGAVDAAVLLGLGIGTEADIDRRRTHHDDELDHEHDEFDSFVVDLGTSSDLQSVLARISAATESRDVLRVKGFVDVAGKPMRLLVQAVGPRIDHYFDRPWAPGEQRRSRLVVIGLAGVDRARIERALGG